MVDNYTIAIKGRSFLGIITDADLVVQVVCLLLFVASIWSWAIIINRHLILRKVRKAQAKFHSLLSDATLSELHASTKLKASSPIEHVFCKMMHELEQDNPDLKYAFASGMGLKDRCIAALEGDLVYLATISSSATFIGLFGTVWGIMHSFQDIAASKNASLAVVAPGIAEALFATAIGLVAAIPALIFYNLLMAKIDIIEREAEAILSKVNSRLKQHFGI